MKKKVDQLAALKKELDSLKTEFGEDRQKYESKV